MTNRTDTLQAAYELVNGARQDDYGTPAESFGRIAALWTPILGLDVQPHQVALCMAMVKAARLVRSPDHSDSWVDLAGYAALGSELTQQEAS